VRGKKERHGSKIRCKIIYRGNCITGKPFQRYSI
jgi:hypothetical protein